MAELALHHVSLVTSDVARSLEFYSEVLGLRQISRPDFSIGGAWLACGDRQIHLIGHEGGTFRSGGVDNNDGHVAFRTDDFDGVLSRLAAYGYREDAAPDDPMHLMVKRSSPAGYLQLYILDPDRNVVEINGAPA